MRFHIVRALFEEALVIAGSVEGAARYLGIHSRTIRKWRQADKEFDAMVARGIERAIDRAESVLFKRAIEKDTRALEFFLKHNKPHVYGDHAVPTSVTVHQTTVNQLLDTDRYTDEQLKASRTFLDRLREAIEKAEGLPAAQDATK
jgi:hypothetical protein